MFPTLYNYPNYMGGDIAPSMNYLPNAQFPEPVKKFNDTKSNLVTYTLLFFLIVFFIIIIVLLFVNTTTRSKLIAPENCPSLKAEYAVVPSVRSSSLSTITQCSGNPDGYQGSQPCTFSNINNLYDAEQLCNKYANTICSGFSYNPSTNVINFINSTYNITSTVGNTDPVDVYLKQNI
jgi:hypothetical protein